MVIRTTHLLTLIVVAGFLAACSSVKESNTGALAVEDISSFLEKRNTRLISLTTGGTLLSNRSGQRHRAQFEMALYKTDSLLMSISGPFGVMVGKLQATPRYFQFYDAFNSQIVEGRPRPENFEKILRIPLSHGDMAALIRGEVPGGFNGFTPYTDREGRAAYLRQDDMFVERVSVSAEASAITEYSRKEKGGATLLSVRYSDFDSEHDVPVARKVSIMFPPAETSITLQCEDIKVNVPASSYIFKAPAGIKRNRI